MWDIRNLLFIDREDQPHLVLKALETSFRNRPNNNNTQILWGMNGSGKTQIALAFAYKYRYDEQTTCPYPCVLWMNVSNILPNINLQPTRENEFEKSLKNLNKELADKYPLSKDLQDNIAREADEYEKLKLWLNEYEKPDHLPEGKRWLLVIDKCPKEEFTKPYHFFRNFSRGDILFTMFENPGSYDGTILVEGMSEAEGLLLLEDTAQSYARRQQISDLVNTRNRRLQAYREFITRDVTYQAALSNAWIQSASSWQILRAIVRASEGNPLVIDTAGRYIATNDAQAYLREYNDKKGYLNAFQNELFVGGAPSLLVAAAWLFAFQKIQNITYAYQLLMLCAYLELDHIPNLIIEHMPEGTAYPFRKDWQLKSKVIEFLIGLSVIDWGSDPLGGRLKKIPRDIIHFNLFGLFDETAEPQIQQIKLRVIHAVSASLPQGKTPEWDKEMKYFLPHIRKCVEYIRENLPFDITDEELSQKIVTLDDRVKIDCVRLLYAAGLYLFEHPQQDLSGEADKLLEHTWRIRQQVDHAASDCPVMVVCSLALAKLYHERSGYYDKAKLESARDKYIHARDACGKLDPIMAAEISNSLGLVYADLWKDASANESFEKALDICRQGFVNAHGEEKLELHTLKAEILKNMAVIAIRDVGRYKQIHAQRHLAKKRSGEASELLNSALNELKGAKNELRAEQVSSIRDDYHKKIKQAFSQCLLLQITLSLCWPPSRGGYTYRNMIEQYEEALREDERAIEECKPTGQEVPAELYMRLITRLNTLAELYRRQEKAPSPGALNQYRKAVTQYDSYHQSYIAPSRELQPIGSVIWENLSRLTNGKFEKTEYKTFFEEFRERYSTPESFLSISKNTSNTRRNS